MNITWLGTAGFKIRTGNELFYLDPFLSRNPHASPLQPLTPDTLNRGARIFISHGHFDHLFDLPEICRHTSPQIFCSETIIKTLTRLQTNPSLIHPVTENRQVFDFDNFKARAFFSHHVKFDWKLMVTTLLRININLKPCVKLFKDYPGGQVLAWRFQIENKIILFFGSAGAQKKDLELFAKDNVDILLLPLQGHSDICGIGLDIVKILKPGMVIPHHHDNFYPPISQSINIQPFIDGFKKVSRGRIRVCVPRMNIPISV